MREVRPGERVWLGPFLVTDGITGRTILQTEGHDPPLCFELTDGDMQIRPFEASLVAALAAGEKGNTNG